MDYLLLLGQVVVAVDLQVSVVQVLMVEDQEDL
jgi:hypothetical protein